MDRQKYQTMMRGAGRLDYEIYLNTESLLACQKEPEDLCNPDELQFMIVHQVEELWMKLMASTLLDIDEEMMRKNTLKALTLFRRVQMCQEMMTQQLSLLETMSPKDYQQIRLLLGNGSGQESPGFRVLLKMPTDLWQTFESVYLEGGARTLEQIYDTEYTHDEAYMVAEALAEFDEQFQKFRNAHMQLIYRSIGVAANSLKGRPVEILNEGLRQKFFPELWQARADMTDRWGGTYGKVRDKLDPKLGNPSVTGNS
jgi:tryptophan 2,3-dioxygenase